MPEQHRIAFTASADFVELLEDVKDVCAHQFPKGNLADIFKAGLKLLLKEADKRKGLVEKPRKVAQAAASTPVEPEPGPTTNRDDIPAAVRRNVWRRDGRACQFPLASGGLCGAKRFLELDHIVPRALGGASTEDNLRVVCRSCNRLAARQKLGDALVDRYTRRAKETRRRRRAGCHRERIAQSSLFSPSPPETSG
jgi:hypothetical protein